MRKLTNSDKQEILKLYRETAETTSTLAERYDVSNSTISRLLKSTLPEDEYEYLVSLKRAARTPEGRAQVNYDQIPFSGQLEPEVPVIKIEAAQPIAKLEPSLEEEDKPTPVIRKARQVVKPEPSLEEEDKPTPVIRKARQVVKPEPSLEEEDKPTPVIRRVRQVAKPEPSLEEQEKSTPIIRRVRRRSASEEEDREPMARQLEIPVGKPLEITSISSSFLDDENAEVAGMDYAPQQAIAEMLGEELLDESEDLDDLEEDLDEEDYEDEEDDLDEPRPLVTTRRFGEAPVQVLPLSVASLPKTCYLVIDRSSELITRPLKDFGDLGQIPTLETQQRTLPVFDNHRVAKRFSTKRDRVIKVPDSKMLHKARTHLQAKGITRLLIDGQVYSLSLV